MVRKIRFPLEMDNGIEVRSMEELRNNFSILKVMDYLKSGRLLIWLKNRYLNDEADAVKELNPEDPECARKLCEIFSVPYEGVEDILKEKAVQKERIHRLKQYTDKEEYESLIEQVAFEQDELYDLLDAGIREIYLCGERFSIPLSQLGITYTGLNNPVVVIDSKEEVDWKKKQITIKNAVFDSKYQAVLDEIYKKKDADEDIMICMDDKSKSLYKWNDERGRFDLFYEFKELDMYYRNIAKDENYVYFMRGTEKYSRKYKIISMDLKNKQIIDVFDFQHKEAFDILCVREGKIFLRGQYPNTNKLLKINMKSKAESLFALDKYVRDILIDERGENAYIRVKFGSNSLDEIYRYELKDREEHLVSKLYNVHAIDLMNDYLLAWGKDTRKNASEEYYYFEYNVQNGKTEHYHGGPELFTQSLWKDEKTEYRLGADPFYSTIEKYPLYKKDLLTGKTTTVCTISRKYVEQDSMGNGIYIQKGNLFIMSLSENITGERQNSGVYHIPQYRIRLSDYQVQKYNGTRYVGATV